MLKEDNMLEEIEIPIRWNPGAGMMYNRDDLPADHPEQTYNYIKREYNVDPELYSIEKPLFEPKSQDTLYSNCGFNAEEV